MVQQLITFGELCLVSNLNVECPKCGSLSLSVCVPAWFDLSSSCPIEIGDHLIRSEKIILDDDAIRCLQCGHEGTVKDFESQAAAVSRMAS